MDVQAGPAHELAADDTCRFGIQSSAGGSRSAAIVPRWRWWGQPVRTATGLMSGLSHARVGVAQGERERALLPWREPAVPVPAAEGLAERLPQWRARRKAPIERVLTQLTRSGRSIARPHRRGREAPDIRNSSARRKGSVPRGRRRRSSRDSGSGGESFKHAGRFGKASRDSSAAR